MTASTSIVQFPFSENQVIYTCRLSDLDLRFEHLRQRDYQAERILLESIRLCGIATALVVITDSTSQRPILIDGFKRCRCAANLGIDSVPLQSIEADIKTGLLLFLRQCRQHGLTDLEYAAVIDQLHKSHAMTLSAIASFLGCSVAWVSLRHGLLEQMSLTVRRLILAGKLPLRCWLYAMRPFTRVKGVDQTVVDRLVCAVAGKALSTRQLFLLTHAYFTGSPLIRQKIEDGHLQQVLAALRGMALDDPARRTPDGQIIEELGQARCCIDRLIAILPKAQAGDEAICLESNIIAGAILRSMRNFVHIVKEYYDRTGQKSGSAGDAPGGHAQEKDRKKLEDERQDGTIDNCRERYGQ
jgi:hypothetical protein